MHYFKQDVTEYIEKLEGVLEECQLKENFDLLSQRFFDIPLSGGKELKGALIQHAIFNSIVENYVPKEIDIIKEQLCYFGDFSKSSLKKYTSKVHNSIKKYISSLPDDTNEDGCKKFDMFSYLERCDNFNKLNKHHFQKDDNVKLFSFSNMWSELSQHETINLTATDIQRIINEQVSFAFTLYSYLFDNKIVLLFNGLFPFEELMRKDEKSREILTKSIFNNEDSIFETLKKRNEAGAYIINKIKEHKIEPLATMLQAGSAIREEQMMDILVGLGVKPFINDASPQLDPTKNGGISRLYGSFIYNKTLHASYLRGLKNKEDYFISIAGALTSYVISQNKIAAIADLNKRLTLSSKRGTVHTDRNHKCGTKYFRNYTIRQPEDLKRIRGMYHMVDDTPIKVDTSNFEGFKNKTIKLRVPSLCNSTLEGGICRYCLGDEMYDLNKKWFFRNGKSNIATYWVNVIGPIAQQALLSAKHNLVSNPRVPTYWLYDDNDNITLDMDGISFTYAFEDRVFIDYNEIPIIPDKLELVEPKKLLMPWASPDSNDYAFFSDKIKVTIDNKYYIIGSDTPFFILMNEIGEPEIGLRHLYENVGITKLYYQLEKGTTFGAIKNAPDRFNLDKFFDIIETISTDYHLAFFHVLFLDLIRKKGDIESIFDFSIPDQELEVVALDAAVIEGHNLTGTFACGEFDEVSCNPKNYATLDKIAVDTDNIIH